MNRAKYGVFLMMIFSGVVLSRCSEPPVAGAVRKNIPSPSTKRDLLILQPIDSVKGFSVQAISGKNFTVGKGSDKKTLLIFFTTWCGTCKEAMPVIDSVFGTTHANYEVLAVGRKHAAPELIDWEKKNGFGMEVAPDSTGVIFQQFASDMVPRFYIVDQQGKIIYQEIGWGNYMVEDFKKRLE